MKKLDRLKAGRPLPDEGRWRAVMASPGLIPHLEGESAGIDDQGQDRSERGVRKAPRVTGYRPLPSPQRSCLRRDRSPTVLNCPSYLRVKSARLSNGKVTGHGRQEEREQVSWMGLCRGCPACPETL